MINDKASNCRRDNGKALREFAAFFKDLPGPFGGSLKGIKQLENPFSVGGYEFTMGLAFQDNVSVKISQGDESIAEMTVECIKYNIMINVHHVCMDAVQVDISVQKIQN